jgi:hypothetical protein
VGNIIPFSNNGDKDKSIKKDDVVILKSMANSSVTAKMRILPQEIHVLMRVLIKERKDVKEFYQEAVAKRDNKEIDYWKTIQETLNSLIGKLKSIQRIEEVLQNLSFIELDCLVGAIEQSLQEANLLELQLIEDEIPLVTEALQKIYQELLPVYEGKRSEFEQEHNKSE